MLCSALFGLLLLQGPANPPSQAGDQKAPVALSKAEQQHQKDIESDIEMGKRFVKEVEKTEHPSDNKEYQDRVNRIGQEIAKIAQVTPVETLWGDKRLNKFDYTFTVLKGEDVNAFSLPGGFIYVYEGLVKYAESDDEIAAVLAHEISHAEERHIATLAHEQSKVTTPALIALLAAIASRNPNMIEGALMVGSNIIQSFTSSWSVQAEQAADHGGFQYLVHSKYNPTAMLTFMERLAMDEHSDPARNIDWGIYRTHPPGSLRAQAILKDMRTYGIPVQRSLVTTRFRTDVRPGKDGVEIWFNKRKLYTFAGDEALQRADDAAAKLNKFFDSEPNLFDVSFDGADILGSRSPLLSILPADAQAESTTLDKLGQKTVDAIKGSLYNYAFNVWTSR
ncbi:MAG TPA: M48 family metalloprotease [Fimbriimonadaceae bacterium]|nr:M48 family metalloprotease [Fimbriimonadaceae bacterium]